MKRVYTLVERLGPNRTVNVVQSQHEVTAPEADVDSIRLQDAADKLNLVSGDGRFSVEIVTTL